LASRRSEEPYPFSENNDHRILIWIAADGTEEISRKLAAHFGERASGAGLPRGYLRDEPSVPKADHRGNQLGAGA